MPVATRSSVPAYLWTPEGSTFAAGDEAAELADSLGFQVSDPELDVLRVLLAEGQDGSWAALESAVVCARQNMKTWALMMTVLYDVFLRDVKRVTWSSHLFRTTQDAFNELDRVIGDTDWLRSRVRRRRASKGEEGFDFVNGGRLDFLARSKGGGRGLSGNSVILDEALYLSAATQGALIPTLSAQPNPAVRYGSSPGVQESAVLRTIRDRGRSLSDPSLAYIEYTSDRQPCAQDNCSHSVDVPGCQLDNEDLWWDANPALGRRISIEYVRDERRALSSDPIEFMRERLGWWDDPASGAHGLAFHVAEWDACGVDDLADPADRSTVHLAVDVSWDRETASVAAAWKLNDGRIAVRIVASMDPSEVPAWLASRSYAVQVGIQQNGAPASSLLPDLQALSALTIHPVPGSDIARSVGSMFDAMKSRMVVHDGDPSLRQQVDTAKPRRVGDGVALDRVSSPLDISGLTAVTLARFLCATTDDTADPGVWFI